MEYFNNRYKGGRPKIAWRSSSLEVYKEFIKQYPQLKINRKDFINIIKEINNKLVEYVLSGDDINLGRTISIRIVKNPIRISQKRLPIDWRETYNQKKVVYFLCNETDRLRFCFNSKFQKPLLKSKKFWKFIPNKSIKKKLQEKIQSGFTAYSYMNYYE